MLSLSELARSQGFPEERLQIPSSGRGVRYDGVSERQAGGMYGNAMNVNTTMRIITRLLPIIGVATHMRDPWSDESTPADCL